MLRYEIKVYSKDNDIIGKIAENSKKEIVKIFDNTSRLLISDFHNNLALNDDIEISYMILFDNKNDKVIKDYCFQR